MDVAKKGHLNPMSFGAAVRAITGKHNMMLEMQMFQRYNSSGSGAITPEEFVEGLKKETDPLIIKGLRAWGKGQLSAF
jgi:Ca2+-binding EF-hand superfamily protein